MFEIATVRDKTLRQLAILLLLDIIVPEAILVIIVHDRYLVFIGDVICGLDVVKLSVGLHDPVGHAFLRLWIKLVVLNRQLLGEYLGAFLISVHLVHFLHDSLEHIALRCFLVIDAVTQEHPLELFRVGTLISCVILSV